MEMANDIDKLANLPEEYFVVLFPSEYDHLQETGKLPKGAIRDKKLATE